MPSTAERRSSPVVPIVVAVVVVLLAVGAVVVTMSGGDDDGGNTAAEGVQQNQPLEITGTALPQLGEDGSDPAEGQQAPDLVGSSFDGTPVSITADGTPKLLVFVAHWCPDCNREVPVVVDWLGGQASKDGVAVYAVSTGVDAAASNYPPSEWLAEEEWPAPVLADDQQGAAGEAFGLSAYPYFVLLDGGGRVVVRESGALEPTELDELVSAAA